MPLRAGSSFTVCGDVHGQYYDLLNIFKLNGAPSEENPYLFNGEALRTPSTADNLRQIALAPGSNIGY